MLWRDNCRSKVTNVEFTEGLLSSPLLSGQVRSGQLGLAWLCSASQNKNCRKLVEFSTDLRGIHGLSTCNLRDIGLQERQTSKSLSKHKPQFKWSYDQGRPSRRGEPRRKQKISEASGLDLLGIRLERVNINSALSLEYMKQKYPDLCLGGERLEDEPRRMASESWHSIALEGVKVLMEDCNEASLTLGG
ncbi:hypothetical protein HI914_01928 [Erysiphe necator]|nr:hypothetical protein HI914_01928 [Erysiphe necator]